MIFSDLGRVLKEVALNILGLRSNYIATVSTRFGQKMAPHNHAILVHIKTRAGLFDHIWNVSTGHTYLAIEKQCTLGLNS
jgi:hypothetical protein